MLDQDNHAAADVARARAWLTFTAETERLARADDLVWQPEAVPCAHPWRCTLARLAFSAANAARKARKAGQR